MNIWALNKDDSIRHLLLMLEDELGDDAFCIVDNVDDDFRATRLVNPVDSCISVYVYTYGQEDERYGAHIEYPDLSETKSSDTLEIYDNLSFLTLVDLLKAELNIVEDKSSVMAGQ